MNLKSELNNFIGTECYYINPLFKNISYTDGVKYFLTNAGNGAYWFLTIIATEMLKVLENEFYFIELTVNQDQTAKITVQLDKDEPILFEKDLSYTDCPPSGLEPYKFCLNVNKPAYIILCLLSEY